MVTGRLAITRNILKKGAGFLDVILIELMADVWLNKRKYSTYEAEWED